MPDGRVDCVIVGEAAEAYMKDALSPYGVRVITCPANALLDARLSSHVDLSLIHLSGNRLLVSDAVCRHAFAASLIKLGAELIAASTVLGDKYPQDCGLCALILGPKLFHNLKHSDKALLSETGYKHIHVNQGYTKCAVCIVSESAVITSDLGVAKRMRENGVDVLTISTGGIELEGYDTGFIGGAAFKLSKDKLAFTGVLDKCSDKERIEEFLAFHGIRTVYLTNRPLFDIGSIVPLTEYCG